ncbi:MAG: hypothetical protein IJF40_03505 [Clostridia bacterium]|nr:hypothetical protein [Clostridia bacterium]
MASRDEIYTNKLFLNAVLPLIKVIANDVPSLKKKFEHAHAVIQVSALDPESPEGKVATHYVVNSGEWVVHNDKVDANPHVELEFKSIETMNAFFKGSIGPKTLPKMKGIAKHTGLFVSFMMVLLKMSSLLTAKSIPEDEDTKLLLTKCYFYLLSSGISQLNKLGHPDVHGWTLKSPDRVYSWAVDGHEEISAYLRIKAGKSRAGRGVYKRAMPFFTMRFNNLDSALGILMSIDDMLESVKAEKLIMEGAPEFGAQLGEYMMLVGSYVQ